MTEANWVFRLLIEVWITLALAATMAGVSSEAPFLPPAIATSEATFSVNPVMLMVMKPLGLSAAVLRDVRVDPSALVTFTTKGGVKPVSLTR